MQNLYFYEVLERLIHSKEPLKARRKKWVDKKQDRYILIVHDKVKKEKSLEMHLFKDGYDFFVSKWSPNSEGLLADDWIIE